MRRHLLLLAAIVITGCARTEPVPADADEIETALNRAHEDAASVKRTDAAPDRP
jgi:hypothetical protein